MPKLGRTKLEAKSRRDALIWALHKEGQTTREIAANPMVGLSQPQVVRVLQQLNHLDTENSKLYNRSK